MATFTGKLMPHQIDGETFAMNAPYHINGFQPGLGKTATSLKVACNVGGKILAVVPAFLQNNWKNEVKKFTKDLDIDIVSYSKLKDIVKNDVYYNMIIADEVHYIKTPKAKRSVFMHEILMQKKPKYFMGLTGTPVKNRVSEFYNTLQACYYGGHYEIFKPFNRLYYKFCNYFSYERTFEANGIPISRFDGLRPTRIGFLKKLIEPVYIRRRADKVLNLPETTDINIREKSKKYDDNLKKAFELFQADASDPAYMTLKSSNALAKISSTKKVVDELLEQGSKVVVFTCHREAVKQLASHYKVKYIDGTVNVDSRQAIVDDFNDNEKTRLLVATVGSASTGFNLTGGNYMVLNDFPFVPADLEQARKRIHRIGQDKPCFYYNIFSSDFDEQLYEMIQRKNKDIGKIYD